MTVSGISKKRTKIKKASFTVEAACVMSIVLVTVMGVLYLAFFVHNRTWLTAAAYEAALTGSMEGVQKTDRYTRLLLAEARNLEMWDSLARKIFSVMSMSEKR